jgi:4a-hydroxytetrahydrobiopterin dehydratase
MTAAADRIYSEAEAAAWLAAHLPHWAVQDGAITRTYRTAGWRATLMVVNTIGHLAEAAWHHPDLAVSYPSVTVRLSTHDAGGITDKDLQLARKIEEIVLWQPAADGGALQGPPPSDAYIRYDA